MKVTHTDMETAAIRVTESIGQLIANTHAPQKDCISDSVTVTKNAWIEVVVDLARTAAWMSGLAESYREDDE